MKVACTPVALHATPHACTPTCPHLPSLCTPFIHSWFVTKEDTYPYISGVNGTAGICDKTKMAATFLSEKVQLTGRGFKRLKPWSAAALRQVG